VQLRFLLGPAGSGKTFRCLGEIRKALLTSVDGPPLVLVAPKQTTYQLERQLLADTNLSGYTRLHILSFERLAYLIFDWLGKTPPEMLNEEGRVMVLRSLLARKRQELKLFRASARLAGFAQELSLVLREVQRDQLTPESLEKLATKVPTVQGLSLKLQDLAMLLRSYFQWLEAHHLQDQDCLLTAAASALQADRGIQLERPGWTVAALDKRGQGNEIRGRRRGAPSVLGNQRNALQLEFGDGPLGSQTVQSPGFQLEQLWVDGFPEISVQELDLLAALMPHCPEAALTFCLDRVPTEEISWLAGWSVVRRSFLQCRKRLASLAGVNLSIQLLERDTKEARFSRSPVLRHLERCWSEPLTSSAEPMDRSLVKEAGLTKSIRLAACFDPEAEATLAAREILSHVHAGGRYRDAMVLVRNLGSYRQLVQHIFARYDIPFFLDQREPMAHHPLAELTRSALRAVAFQWVGDDWFAALKTGLVPAEDSEIDELENEALARGWKGRAWHSPLELKEQPRSEAESKALLQLQNRLEALRQRLIPPFQRLSLLLAGKQNKVTGTELAAALREFWTTLGVQQRLLDWATAEISESTSGVPSPVHATVWTQMHDWLANLELAFADEALSLREWLSILEAGMANLSVGVVPPALDQVLIGAVDRSRDPDVRLAIVLGLNEGVFPAPPETTLLLTESDKLELQNHGLLTSNSVRQQLGRERFYAYLACTRPRERLVLTCALRDANGRSLNSSPFVSQVLQLFPGLKVEQIPRQPRWQESLHPAELVGPLLTGLGDEPANPSTAIWERLGRAPSLAPILARVRHFKNPQFGETLAPTLAERLYGPVLRSSVSRMEEFAACPFKFFVHSGLRAEERKCFELDPREQGTFQHDVLAAFHQQLVTENLRWRDITPQEARKRVARIAQALVASYRDGLLQATEQSRFLARAMTGSLQDFVETLVTWMRQQYLFDPAQVELPFGYEPGSPAWAADLGAGHRLELQGRIDRIDLYRQADANTALCVVLDYKSSHKQLDTVLVENGIQLQLLAYLNVLRHWPDPHALFGVDKLIPAGVFYVNLRGRYNRQPNRLDALATADEARKQAYRHVGRFDAGALEFLDSREDVGKGDQFNYCLRNDGRIQKCSREALDSHQFKALLGSVEANLMNIGRGIFAGAAAVAPFRKGTTTACEQCGYSAICRIDPWAHRFRVLKKREGVAENGEAPDDLICPA
jgi:ATP-dependent helicase/nuclease subunit B